MDDDSHKNLYLHNINISKQHIHDSFVYSIACLCVCVCVDIDDLYHQYNSNGRIWYKIILLSIEKECGNVAEANYNGLLNQI